MSIGVVIVGHEKLPEDLIRIAEDILKVALPFISVSVFRNQDLQLVRQTIAEAIEKADQGQGVLLLTDIFGATPANLCLPFLKKGQTEMVTGVNLAMVLKLAASVGTGNLRDWVSLIEDYGRRYIHKIDWKEI